MADKLLEVESLDCVSGHVFVIHFNDNTYATITAVQLAACVPTRLKLPKVD
jgi:hypothetical protein